MNDKPPTAATVTVSVEHDANPNQVTAVIADPRKLPAWAPMFAEHVAPLAGDRWTATCGTRTFPFTISEVSEAGVVDVLRERPDGELLVGARFRAMPRDRGGCVVTMTMAVFDGDLSASTRVAHAELTALMRMVG